MKKILDLHLERGFTLIELLVVIVIIGILAAIVLASLSTARAKGSDANIKSELHNIRTAADLYFSGNGSAYGPANGAQIGLCTAAAGGSTMWTNTSSGMNGVIMAVTSVIGASKMDCGTSAAAWSVAVQLPSGSYWCVDNQGTARGSLSGGSTYAGLNAGATSAHTVPGAIVCN